MSTLRFRATYWFKEIIAILALVLQNNNLQNLAARILCKLMEV